MCLLLLILLTVFLLLYVHQEQEDLNHPVEYFSHSSAGLLKYSRVPPPLPSCALLHAHHPSVHTNASVLLMVVLLDGCLRSSSDGSKSVVSGTFRCGE